MRVRKDAHERYPFDPSLISPSGHLLLRSVRAAHVVANLVNAGRDPEQHLSPAALNAASIIQEVQRYAIAAFTSTQDPALFGRTLKEAEEVAGTSEIVRTLTEFVGTFPTKDILESKTSPELYLTEPPEAQQHRESTVEQMLVSWLSNENPAFSPFSELVGDSDVRASTRYEDVIGVLSGRNDPSQKAYASARTLIDLLQEPARRAPHSLKDQLAFMAGEEWSLELPEDLARQITLGGDLIDEEDRALAARHFAPGPPPPPPVPDYSDEPEYEQFSQDIDWMPRVVMMAKNAYVWLDQLSKKHGRPIKRLDEIPEEEIERLAGWGVTALWLIGVWQRSDASRRLKHWSGNPDAEASAYSLDDYVIADQLGGPGAVTGFRMVCQRHGIRLASDMVPNHTGLDSKWVKEHPDWFIQLPYPPYPSYSYSSESLSDDPDLTIQVEDGYYSRSDAAVTFRRFDPRTGDERFVYHGNDGTSMPWNDTAQLDFTRSEVREAVIQTILHVARQFPIIRFDAAMVLTRKHFRRLWYPTPGSGGGVPSRAEHGLSQQEFDLRMPNEFWREVVDRVAAEVPDTLLLAEAFWLLEGYFVRTLGMHRVYNSAFMHMLKDEDNAKYREVMKNTMAFEPEVLKRYVNFMSNPDEETAIEQFGDGDKYFGVATLLVTMPGLPMIAHGQIEGFSEKYGMEYHRAYHDEEPRQDLIERFEREITPLIRKRHLFAEVANFYLFDFETPGGIDDNVFAYSNRSRGESALIVYNNRYGGTAGRIHVSTELGPNAARNRLTAALGLDSEPGAFVTFRDLTTGLEYILALDDLAENGLTLSLDGYQCHAFSEFTVIDDDEDGMYSDLASRLAGRGVENLDEAVMDLRFKAFERLLTSVLNTRLTPSDEHAIRTDEISDVAEAIGCDEIEIRDGLEKFGESLDAVGELRDLGRLISWPRSKRYKNALRTLEDRLSETSQVPAVLIGVASVRLMLELGIPGIGRLLKNVLLRTWLAAPHSVDSVQAVACVLSGVAVEYEETTGTIETLADRATYESAFAIHEFGGTTYYNKERFELGLAAAFCMDIMTIERRDDVRRPQAAARSIAALHDEVERLRDAHEQSEYDWDRFVSAVGKRSKEPPAGRSKRRGRRESAADCD
jgi:glycosidase